MNRTTLHGENIKGSDRLKETLGLKNQQSTHASAWRLMCVVTVSVISIIDMLLHRQPHTTNCVISSQLRRPHHTNSACNS
jgi:hypothetical protein